MKKLLNTVYVTTEGAALRKDGETLVAEVEGETKARVPLHMLASVVAFGPILVSPALIGACAGAGISLVLLDRAGPISHHNNAYRPTGSTGHGRPRRSNQDWQNFTKCRSAFFGTISFSPSQARHSCSRWRTSQPGATLRASP